VPGRVDRTTVSLRWARLDLMLAAVIGLLALLASIAPALATEPGASPTPAATAEASTPGVSPSPAATPPCPNPTPPPPPPAGASPTPATQTPAPNLCPAQLNASDPVSIFAWLFTPIFQALFMTMAFIYNIVGDIGIAIIGLTLVIRLISFPLYRSQIVSQRRMQALQPEIRAITAKYKGNRAKISEEQMRLYRERGVSPFGGCLPTLLQLLLLLPMYLVIQQGLAAPDISSMLQVFGQPVLSVACQDPGNPLVPCIDPIVPWLDWVTPAPGGLDAHVPEVLLMVIPGVFGLSLLALVSALLQLVQTRMMTQPNPTNDPQIRTTQRMFLILPLFSLIYGWFLPAGLFIYWITTTLFSIVQQYLIIGWGGLFPLFGWTPGFARDHQPRFPVQSFTPREPNSSTPDPAIRQRSSSDRAAGTIRPARTRGRTSRRGRRR
jgi:YidC/Oxa1 family membrane protein insertase